MNRQIRYIAQRVIVGLVIALVLSFAHRAFAADGSIRLVFKGNYSAWVANTPAGYASVCSSMAPFVVDFFGAGYSVLASGYACLIINPQGNLRANMSHESRSDPPDPPDDPAENCPAEGENHQFFVDISGDPDSDGGYSSQFPASVVSNGCTFGSPDMEYCGSSKDGNGGFVGSCLVNYTSNHAIGDESNGPDLTSNEFTDGDDDKLSRGHDQSQDIERETKQPSVETELEDGTQQTIDVSSMFKQGGGSSTFNVVDGGAHGTIVDPSSSTTTTTVTSTYPPQGGSTVNTDVSTTWKNGDIKNIDIDSDGYTVTVSKGDSGSHSTNTKTTTHPDGSSESETTSDGDGQGDSNCSGDGCGDGGGGAGMGPTDVAGDAPGVPTTTIELPEISASGQQLDSSCPEPYQLSVLDYTIPLSFAPMCELGGYIGALVLAVAWLGAARVVAGGVT